MNKLAAHFSIFLFVSRADTASGRTITLLVTSSVMTLRGGTRKADKALLAICKTKVN
jgi:hypothetical protein